MLQILGNIETYKGRVVEEFDIGSSSSTIRYWRARIHYSEWFIGCNPFTILLFLLLTILTQETWGKSNAVGYLDQEKNSPG